MCVSSSGNVQTFICGTSLAGNVYFVSVYGKHILTAGMPNVGDGVGLRKLTDGMYFWSG